MFTASSRLLTLPLVRVLLCSRWVIIVINLGVHVLLYAYYGFYELKVDLWWKVRQRGEQNKQLSTSMDGVRLTHALLCFAAMLSWWCRDT
jgi:uncharacterized membrane protein YqhA